MRDHAAPEDDRGSGRVVRERLADEVERVGDAVLYGALGRGRPVLRGRG